MRTLILLLALFAAVGLVGCGKQPPEPPPALSVSEWEAMPVGQKYTPETLERLKEGNPKLQAAEGWNEFSRTTLARNRARDFPDGQNHRKK